MRDDYQMEELIPIVAWLTEKFTSGESSSVSYERARQLMGAVIYCMDAFWEAEERSESMVSNRLAPEIVYRQGYECVLQKVRKTTELYQKLMSGYRDFGNENYKDTVTKAIPGFLKYYDARFAPQDTIISMDYPTIVPVIGKTGVDAVYEYVKNIYMEQCFLEKFPEAYVCDILSRYHSGYRKQFFNLSRILVRHVIGCALTENEPSYEKLELFLKEKSIDSIRKILKPILHKMIFEVYEGNMVMEAYLAQDMKDFSVELRNGILHGCPDKVVVL